MICHFESAHNIFFEPKITIKESLIGYGIQQYCYACLSGSLITSFATLAENHWDPSQKPPCEFGWLLSLSKHTIT